ncbi:MAG: hypothetical protein JST00_17995 [Deltaproteobacteria bacterium]|nr:hypothetical protein [Deltaproteobacteria bacterium]
MPTSTPRRAALAGLAALTLTLAATPASADDDGPRRPIGRVAIGDEMRAYYRSERDIAILFTGLGFASVGGGTVLVTRDSDFARGLGGSMIAVGGVQLLMAIFYGLEVSREITHYEKSLAANPGAFKIEEGEHIHGTTSRFTWYRAGELAIAGAGLGAAIYGFAADEDTWKGIGIGVAAEALAFFVIDSFGQARARRYEKKVIEFEPGIASMSLRGSF